MNACYRLSSVCSASSIYHDVDFSFPLLDDEGASQSQALIRVMTFQSLPQSRHKTLVSGPLLGPHLDDLRRDTGEEGTTVCAVTFILLMFIFGSTHVTGLKSTHSNFSEVADNYV